MSEEPNEVFQSTRELGLIFIHSSVDDAGLTPNQFRVLAHLSRRAGDHGRAFCSNATISKVCNIHEDTVIKSIAELERRKMLIKEPRPGKTTIWRLTPPSYWDTNRLPKTGEKGRPNSTPPKQMGRYTNPPETNGVHPPETNGVHPPETNGDEGTPSKVIHLRKSQKVATLLELPNGSSKRVIDAWEEWKQHRKEKRDPVTPLSAKRTIGKLSEWGEERWLSAIDHSITGGYTGLFEPKTNSYEDAKEKMRRYSPCG